MMKYSELKIENSKSLFLSKLCFGTLTMGALQANLPVDVGAEVIFRAFLKGVNFLDTAEIYMTYPYIKKALAMYEQSGGNPNNIIISTKTYAYTRELAKTAFENAVNSLGLENSMNKANHQRQCIDIFMLHEQESIHTIRGHEEALLYLCEQREKGRIKAIGLSTHHVDGVLGAIEYNRLNKCKKLNGLNCEKVFDIVHPIYNRDGLGIIAGEHDSTEVRVSKMRDALAEAKKNGLFIFAMKALGGGNLYKDAQKAFDFVLSDQNIDSVAVGMKTTEELEFNIDFFENGKFPTSYYEKYNETQMKKKKLHIESWCEGCGECTKVCSQGAITIADGDIAKCNLEKCILCGYCARKCKIFAIKVV